MSPLALADRRLVGGEPEPREILEDGGVVSRARADGIVVLDAQQHAAVAAPRNAPDVRRVDDVPEVEEAGGAPARIAL